MNEKVGLALYAVGGVISLIGFVWLVIRGFGVKPIWGVAILLTGGLLGIPFALIHRQKGLIPLGIMLAGNAITASPFIYNVFFPPKIDDTKKVEDITPEEIKPSPAYTQIAGKKVTLTGAARTEYAILKEEQDFTVIQWANLDVTDDDAQILGTMKKLTEIDLSNSQVTDVTAKILLQQEDLEIVKIARTKITANTAAEFLKLPKLREVDFRGLNVPTKALQDWKAANKETRKYIN
jgi:Leucine-rich repeat (LRR) protein